ncbi:MAG: carboxypeptidase-like regulatory domain-containing protein [Gemmatimonadetes bacterium]|nr:carboxypeptidase-like regulatory domain-containing protein [Gemmatimonadota bacterium]
MRTVQKLLTAALMLVSAAPLAAQGRTVTGTVRSRPVVMVGAPVQVSAPIAGAVVHLKDETISVRTDANGAFRIEMPALSSEILVVSHPDYDAAEVTVAGQTTIDVLLLSPSATTSMVSSWTGSRWSRRPVTA